MVDYLNKTQAAQLWLANGGLLVLLPVGYMWHAIRDILYFICKMFFVLCIGEQLHLWIEYNQEHR